MITKFSFNKLLISSYFQIDTPTCGIAVGRSGGGMVEKGRTDGGGGLDRVDWVFNLFDSMAAIYLITMDVFGEFSMSFQRTATKRIY